MNVARDCNAAALRFKLCFFKIRKANGRRVEGGRRMGRIVVITAGLLKAGGGGGGLLCRAVGGKGWSGVAKAGEEE